LKNYVNNVNKSTNKKISPENCSISIYKFLNGEPQIKRLSNKLQSKLKLFNTYIKVTELPIGVLAGIWGWQKGINCLRRLRLFLKYRKLTVYFPCGERKLSLAKVVSSLRNWKEFNKKIRLVNECFLLMNIGVYEVFIPFLMTKLMGSLTERMHTKHSTFRVVTH